MTDDPFSCFDDKPDNTEDDDEDDNGTRQSHRQQRDESCGVLAFHHGTEKALLLHVKQYCDRIATYNSTVVRQAVDSFCIERHWMMHVGPNKSHHLRVFLKQACIAREERIKSSSRGSTTTSPFVLLELGTYCGYSSIMWAETLLQQQRQSEMETRPPNFHVYTVETSQAIIPIAQEMIRLAQLESYISVLYLDYSGKSNPSISNLLNKHGISHVDFLFLDHDKNAYLKDLQDLEQATFLGGGAYVAADNVLFARIDNYRRHMQQLAQQGIVETWLEKGNLEYSEMEPATTADPTIYQDGIEFTIYLSDPPK